LHSDGAHTVDILNYGDGDMSGNYIISINVEATQQRIPNIDILDQLLKYIAPTGYTINYRTFIGTSGFTTKTANSEEINILFVNEDYGSAPRATHDYVGGPVRSEMENRIVGGASTTVIRYTNNRGEGTPKKVRLLSYDKYKLKDCNALYLVAKRKAAVSAITSTTKEVKIE
jgi:hypothetical protein